MRRAFSYIVFSGLAFLIPSFSAHSQAPDRCGTVEYTKTLHPNPALKKINFEKWLSEKNWRGRFSRNARQQVATYQIPVVVHVIHNGEAIGVGANISDAQVMSQIRVLNEDFRRENEDAVNTPPEFTSVAGSLDIEFVLAKQDKDGQATSGIVRVNGGRSSWTINNNYILKDLSYWPAEQYMNIWVCNLTGHLGYAQFPESDLEGLDTSSTNRLTDGIVIWHKAFGSIADGNFSLDPRFNKGRTATHETGHFLGLNHIWGDEPLCRGTDYVSDTPNQADQTDGCPAHPKTDMCGEVIMFQNFLDYANDACMNLFTLGQADRMATVIENSPRRKTLLTSPGLQEPDPVPNDLGLRTIVFPDASVCSNLITPVLEVRNYGSNAVTSAKIRFVLDGTTVETKDFSLNLGLLSSTEVSFSPRSLPSGNHDISFRILTTNGSTDGGSYNDLLSSMVIIPTFGTVPFTEDFNTPPAGWIIDNPDGQVTWEIVTAPNEMADNKALKLDYYGYEDKIGEIDMFLSPVMDLSSVPAATLIFDVAYARYQSSDDRLRVVVLTDCQSYSEGTVLYDRAGFALQTTPAISATFTPSNESQWRQEQLDLSPFIGSGRVQLAFVGINDWGNNIYIDNITVFTDARMDVALARLISPSAVTCTDEVAPRMVIQNTGTTPLTNTDVHYSVNDGPIQTIRVNHPGLAPGAVKEITLPSIKLEEGLNTLWVQLADPGGVADFNPDDNEKTFAIVANKREDRIPLREDFEGAFTPAWTAINPTGGMNWEVVGTNFGQSLYFNAYNNDQPGDEAWLVSPVLDFSATSEASVVFDLSYGSSSGLHETLSVLASTDCGVTYNEIAYNFPSAKSATGSWVPQGAEDWATNVAVNLNAVAGFPNVRIAFVITNQNVNNLYLDNIEFFVTADPEPIEVEGLYAIYGYDLSNPESTELKITFNLPERQNVRYSLISATGQLETDGVITDVLNQTYLLDPSRRLTPGIYFVRVQIGEQFYSRKILVF